MARIHCILLTKNEADIIGMCLRESAKWAHRIYVYDGHSTDGTWEIARSMASDVVVPWKSEDRVFQEYLRRDVFEAFRSEVRPGDWWLQLNADEFYVERPDAFLDALPESSQVVWGNSIEYYLTDVDVEKLDFTQPVEKILPELRYYRYFNSERRFFKYRPRLVWSPNDAWPMHLGVIEKRRIVFRHYPYRSPDQIQKRVDRRRESRALGFKGGDHDNVATWQEKIFDHRILAFDKGCSPSELNEAELAPHLPPIWHQVVQRLMHSTGLWA